MLTLVARIFQIVESKKFEEISASMGVFMFVVLLFTTHSREFEMKFLKNFETKCFKDFGILRKKLAKGIG